MVPEGGLFVPESIPSIDPAAKGETYQDTARRVLTPFLTDFSAEELDQCIQNAYNADSFETNDVVAMAAVGDRHHVLELWHGPTAAFKDVALQIMPHFMAVAKQKTGERAQTLILVATSGDTGKAALEGFRDCEGISILVFFPHGGVSEIQRLQMVTTGGGNTHVAAVTGNFDDCQSGVKRLFSDPRLSATLRESGYVFSSANSINWGRLCPQIVYYFRAYGLLVNDGTIQPGDSIDFCVPTGNFGNILAGYYAKRMGLPIGNLLCASNRNRVLADFFSTGRYDRNREFYRTMSPSMDILISSNLERFLFEMADHDAQRVNAWFRDLSAGGVFEVDSAMLQRLQETVIPGWVGEDQVLDTIRAVHSEHGYVLDTHTAVAMAMARQHGGKGRHVVVDATASPYKFSPDVVRAITGESPESEFQSIARLHELSALPVHRAVRGLRERAVRHDKVIDPGEMEQMVLSIVQREGVKKT
jgi:threonine synthase